MAGKNKTIRNVIIGVVALAVLAGVYFLVTKWEPESGDGGAAAADAAEDSDFSGVCRRCCAGGRIRQ